ncbi:hypothetical protein [Polymorphobacter megasporae]|uniref:hypothetical protein n=1 Tax=Glacieibacterium megasporae TaxID=2835787 RepID=UPI001C1E78D0|nr:hypothetical protein [Polymorphobacter megasporae]UAJ09603.1 hypothetical protein KTC28_15000 [Polymorphobacter megasporae]
MDKMVYREIDDKDRINVDDFAALFAQLDDGKAAPIDAGLTDLFRKIEELHRPKDCQRH